MSLNERTLTISGDLMRRPLEEGGSEEGSRGVGIFRNMVLINEDITILLWCDVMLRIIFTN